MKVRDVMTTELVTVGPDAPLKAVVERLVRAGVSGLPVVDDGRLVGMITEADLISKEAYGDHRPRALALLSDALAGHDHHWVEKAAGAVASEVMTAAPATCRPADDVRMVARRMLESKIKRLPVVDDGELVGIVARHDVLAMFDRPDEEIAGALARALSNDSNMPEEHSVHAAVHDGVVTLTGEVRYDWDVAIVVGIARDVAGVIEVDCHLNVRQKRPPGVGGKPYVYEPWDSVKPWMFNSR